MSIRGTSHQSLQYMSAKPKTYLPVVDALSGPNTALRHAPVAYNNNPVSTPQANLHHETYGLHELDELERQRT